MARARLMLTCVAVAGLTLVGLSSAAEAGAKRRIVYFSQTQGYRHEQGIALVRKLLKADPRFEVDECTDCTTWTPEYLGRYDAMVSFGSGELPLTEANKKALLDFVRGGKGFVGIHSAIYMCPKSKWPAFTEMINGTFINHPWSQKVRVIVEDHTHPATAHLGEAFELKDEIYQFGQWSRQKTHVLLSLDNASVDVNKKDGKGRPLVRRADRDFGIAWCHPYGEGRVFFTALGHGASACNDPRYQKHLVNGLLWALGDLAAPAPLGTDGRPKK